jgi:hypothetical protein
VQEPRRDARSWYRPGHLLIREQCLDLNTAWAPRHGKRQEQICTCAIGQLRKRVGYGPQSPEKDLIEEERGLLRPPSPKFCSLIKRPVGPVSFPQYGSLPWVDSPQDVWEKPHEIVRSENRNAQEVPEDREKEKALKGNLFLQRDHRGFVRGHLEEKFPYLLKESATLLRWSG